MAHEIEEGPDGLYSICVFNAADCSDDEIHEIFGKFGSISRLNRSGTTTFVRFQTREEAIDCCESMKGDARFNVKPGKRKGGSSSNNFGRNKENRFDDMNRNDNPRGRRETGGGGDFAGSAASARGHPPKLIPFPHTPEDVIAPPKQTAKVVVIANLHPKLGQNKVYELCTKCQAPPLHVAMKVIKRPPYPNISYAFVYVRNEKEANSIITSLNNLKLNGFKLVVSSVEKLDEEGKALMAAK